MHVLILGWCDEQADTFDWLCYIAVSAYQGRIGLGYPLTVAWHQM